MRCPRGVGSPGTGSAVGAEVGRGAARWSGTARAATPRLTEGRFEVSEESDATSAVQHAMATSPGMSFVAIDVLGRVSVASAFLLRPSVQRGTCALVAVAVGALAARRLPARVWSGWLPITWACVVALGCVWFVVAVSLHVRWGTPRTRCERPGLEVEECVGRDWSFLQGRLGYARMSGAIDTGVCQRFVAGVPDAPASAIDGAGRVRCPYDDPSVWARGDCAAIGIQGRAQCFTCSGMSSSHDLYTHVQAFDDACTEATITFGVNVPPSRIDACQRSVDQSVCAGEP